jgi:hypothetical protein
LILLLLKVAAAVPAAIATAGRATGRADTRRKLAACLPLIGTQSCRRLELEALDDVGWRPRTALPLEAA